MNGDLKRMQEEVVVAYSRYFLGIYPEGPLEIIRTSVSRTDVSVEIQTRYFSNTNLQFYHYTSPVDKFSLLLCIDVKIDLSH
jgi:hypothetical protein